MRSINIVDNRNLQYKIWGILLFILYPIFSLPFIFRGIIRREKWAYFLASIFMGYMGILYPPTGDMYRYAEDFNLYKELDWEYFLLFMALKFDYFLPFLSWCLGKLGFYPESTRFLFIACSYVMLFSLYNDIINSNKNITKYYKIYSLLLLVPIIFTTYLFRMGFGQITLVYGIYWYMIKNEKKGLFFIILATFIHISYIPFIFIIIASKIPIFNFSSRTFIILCLLLIFVESSSIGISIIRLIPFSESLTTHLEHYITGNQSEKLQFSIKQIIVNQYSNIVYYLTLYQYYVFYKNNPQNMRIKNYINIFILIIILSSSIPVLHTRLLSVLKTFLILSSVYFYNQKSKKIIKIVFLFTLINTMFSLWQLRFVFRFGQYDLLYKSTSVGLITHHYTDEWIRNNIDSEGLLIEWLKLGYRPAETK